LQRPPDADPRRPAKCEKIVERVPREHRRHERILEQTRRLENGQVDDNIPERDANPWSRLPARLKNAEGKILQRKVRISRNIDE
jgi:hypothetical protein